MHGRSEQVVDISATADAAKITATPLQLLIGVAAFSAIAGSALSYPAFGAGFLLLVQTAFLIMIPWRLVTVMTSQAPAAEPQILLEDLPRYSILVALHDEAGILPHLIERLAAIEYPADRLDGYLVMEAHDRATIDAALGLPRPEWLQVLVAPPGAPTTKPRALNYALSFAQGEFLTIYDAEDDPDPLQLQESVARFAAADERLACLQAPLRIRRRGKNRNASPFLDRQFAAEYAALFEITLPAMARLGLPFPLGGTSNHFRMSALRAAGGWDSWNVTEDADLGFRLWRQGWRLGVLSRPTYETPPGQLLHWLPQRTRWLKGYMQTLFVHTRSSHGMGWRGWTALSLTLGAALTSAALHALSVASFGVFFLLALLARRMPEAPWLGLGVLLCGAAAAILTTVIGARRAGTPFGVWDMARIPLYWSLLSLAFVHAAVRLIVEPHRWDKTAHQPDIPHEDLSPTLPPIALESGRAAA